MIPNIQIRQIILLLIIAALLGLIFWNLRLFVPSLLGAYTLYVVLRKPMTYLTEDRKWSAKLSAALLMILSFVIILLPLYFFIRHLFLKLKQGFQDSDQLVQSLQASILKIEASIGMQLVTKERIESFSAWAMQEVSSILNATLVGALMLLVTYFILWFMLTERKEMKASFFEWLPLKEKNTDYVRTELNNLVYSNAISIPVMGVFQGIAGFIGYWLAGAEDIWFWVILTFISGMIPVVGVALAFVPLSLVLFAKGMTTQAIFILIYGLAVIGTVDNFARMWLLKKIGNTHPLITLFGVVVGLQLFGFIGFIFGPIMIAMFLLLLKIYAKEFR